MSQTNLERYTSYRYCQELLKRFEATLYESRDDVRSDPLGLDCPICRRKLRTELKTAAEQLNGELERIDRWVNSEHERIRAELERIAERVIFERITARRIADNVVNTAQNAVLGCIHRRNKSEECVRFILKHLLGHDFPPYSPNMLKALGIELRNGAGNLMYLDGYCPSEHLAFEYHGWQHTDPQAYFTVYGGGLVAFVRRMNDDTLKREQCKAQGINLIEIYVDEHGGWPDLNKMSVEILQSLSTNKKLQERRRARITKKALHNAYSFFPPESAKEIEVREMLARVERRMSAKK